MKIKLVDGKPVTVNVDKLIDFLSSFETNKATFTRSGKYIFIEDPSKGEGEDDEDDFETEED
jgi:hypothetical protein